MRGGVHIGVIALALLLGAATFARADPPEPPLPAGPGEARQAERTPLPTAVRLPPPVPGTSGSPVAADDGRTRRAISRDLPDRLDARRAVLKLFVEQGLEALAALAGARPFGAAARVNEAQRFLARRATLSGLDKLVRSRRAAVRRGVALALQYRPRVAAGYVGRLLADPSADVLQGAAHAAGRLRLTALVPRLVRLLRRRGRRLRASVIDALARLGRRPAAQTALRRALLAPRAAERIVALRALVAAGARWAFTAVLSRTRDRDPRVRQRALLALPKLGRGGRLLAAAARLRRDRDRAVRRAAGRLYRELRGTHRPPRRRGR